MMKASQVQQICSQFSKKKILIFGDVILDRYIFGSVNRISPEAPVPVVKVVDEEIRLGGAGNVAANIDSLGAEGLLVGITGNDTYSDDLFDLKKKNLCVVKTAANHTLVKTRIIAQRQQIVRVDRETRITVSTEMETALLQRINSSEIDGIIISDYAKGSLTETIMEGLKKKAAADNIPIIVDPKPPNYHLYKNVTGITPNLKEAEAIVNKEIPEDKDAEEAARAIRDEFKTQFAIVTRGDNGITAVEGDDIFHLPVFSHEVYDVTGAGDTVVSVLVLALVSGAKLKEAAALANAAASIVVEKVGTSTVTTPEIIKRMAMLFEKEQ
ncbi:MAG: D-glycero-beta-D-manno-heptose-7-phosphate kinase [bacterium]|nr:D-glycero-beta-D-manno-heptose-7-phosphate kinase [bacterium]